MTVLYIFYIILAYSTHRGCLTYKNAYKILRHETSRKGTLTGPSRRWKDDITMNI